MHNKSWIGKTLALAVLPMALGSAWAQTAPQMTPEEMEQAKQMLLRTLCRLPWRAAQGRHWQEPGAALEQDSG